jgi:manganese/zinc/iron transport system ATP- binding protein
MGLLPLNSGYIQINGKPLEEMRHKISYVPQRESVDWDFPTSVYEVVMMGRYGQLGLFNRPKKSDKEIVMDSLRKVGMDNFKDRQISQLLGGQQQRVFLARALAQQADIYFMDEPFAGVDAATEKAIIELLGEMSAQNKTVIVVHHDLQSVAKYFDWIILLNMRLVASGPINEAFTPELLQETYGGKLTLLTEISDLIQKNRFPNRE